MKNNTTHKLLICIAPQNQGEKLYSIANENGASGGTLMLGRGTAQNAILQLLGLGDTSKDLVFIVSKTEEVELIAQAIHNAESTKRSHFGVLLSVGVNNFFRAGESFLDIDRKDLAMERESGVQLIQVIVNKGYADDVMAAARKAGATGGTIINARGTAKSDDAEFFGIQLVPEKEILLTIVEGDKADDVYKAICELPCLAEKGSGIAFRIPGSNFDILGKPTGDAK